METFLSIIWKEQDHFGFWPDYYDFLKNEGIPADYRTTILQKEAISWKGVLV